MKIRGELKIIKDHYHFRRIKRTKPLTVHTECLHKDNVWRAVQAYVNQGGKAIWYVVTPVNFDFAKTESGIKISPRQWEKKILQRYKWLQKRGQEIQLHIHLRIKMSMYESEADMKGDIERKIKGGVGWLRKNGFKPTKIVFGWWSYNNFAVSVAKRHELHMTQRLDYYFVHDYDFIERKEL